MRHFVLSLTHITLGKNEKLSPYVVLTKERFSPSTAPDVYFRHDSRTKAQKTSRLKKHFYRHMLF